MDIPRLAVVATHNRPVELARLLDALAPQCHAAIVVDNASNPPVRLAEWHANRDVLGMRQIVIRDGEQPPNLSRLWNVGLDAAREYVRGGDYIGHDVAVLNDDAVPPPGWWDAVSGAMRQHGASAASADVFHGLAPGQVRIWFADAPMSVTTRLAGWAFMLPGEEGLRLDERFRWLCGDDDISYRARLAGGLVHVGGYPVPNTGADTSTRGVLAEQGARDMQTFVDVHGRRPW
jgi:GT2 family glycosyltransferase